MESVLEAIDSWPPGDRLTWFPELGCGYYPVDQIHNPYDDAYFQKYVSYSATLMGKALNTARMEMVARHWSGELIDVGIGCGSFVDARRHTGGYDVNPRAVEWLKLRKRYMNPYLMDAQAVSLWDALEHIPRFDRLLEHVKTWAFISLPVFAGAEDARRSRHFRPDEHCWYFTERGLIEFMHAIGWACFEQNDTESVLGRHQIASFAFRRFA